MNKVDDFKDELLLSKDEFNQPEIRKDMLALAQVIQNLLIIEKGTYPNQPKLGIGIKNYLFEFIDYITLSNLEEEIKDQISEFIPNNYIIDLKADVITSKNNKTVLGILFYITELGTNKIEKNFLIIMDKEKKTNNIISKIIL